MRGRNCGWPLYSLGVNYDGTPVDGWKKLGPSFDLESIERPVVDLTPSPAVSSFIFCQGTAFPRREGNLIVGTRTARELYRLVLEHNQVVQKETLHRRIGRIRDVQEGADACIYLLIEYRDGGRVLRLKPARAGDANLAARSDNQQCDSAPWYRLM